MLDYRLPSPVQLNTYCKYLSADLVAALSGLQMYDFPHSAAGRVKYC